MTKLPVTNCRQLRKVAEAAGFHWVRREGSHNTFQNDEGRVTVIPDHGSQVIVRPLLRKILRDLDLSVDEYVRLLNKR